MTIFRKMLASLAACTLCCIAGVAHADTFNLSYTFASGDVVQGTVVGKLAGNTISSITSMDFKLDGVDFGSSLVAQSQDASGTLVDGLTLSTVAALNSFYVADTGANYVFSFSVNPDSGATQVGFVDYASTAQSAVFEDAVQSHWTVTAAVPEPASVALMLAGLCIVGAAAKRRRAA